MRKDLQDARDQIRRARSERQVRDIVADVNQRIRQAAWSVSRGPALTVMPLDVEQTVREWREGRADQSG